MNINELYALYLQHPEVCTDTRQIRDGVLFFALKGERFDGNAFAAEALAKGAAYAVVDDSRYATDARCLLVDSVLQTLQELAHHHRMQWKIPVVGITGTNGKTTTKELVSAVLSRKYKVSATVGNLNNHIGVPLTLLSVMPDTEIAVVEMGANHPGEIADLCAIAEPDFGLITNVGVAHLEGFGTLEEILRTKTALYEAVAARGGVLFVSADDSVLKNKAEALATIPDIPSLTPWYLDHGFGPDWQASQGLSVYTYGQSEEAQCFGRPDESALYLRFTWTEEGREWPVQTQLVGGYNFSNALAACAVGRFFGVPSVDCTAALEQYRPTNSRSQIIDKQGIHIVLDAYNANPSSMEQALRNFARIPSERKMLVLGDMLELGAGSLHAHQQVVRLIQTLGFTEVCLFGSEFARTDAPAAWKFESMELLQQALTARLAQQSPEYMLVKGSRGRRMERVLEVL
ncbi:MAG: UDP-N-acetylmuramoyl-tripeptide--D-alanyl-D-alanine ligase [Bacteroidales bacterium]|nr:UDP-N-acetylmuramoyl-tripeptide--D-alanyl-D-alanine ligase [Bacteroidales bacterium]